MWHDTTKQGDGWGAGLNTIGEQYPYPIITIIITVIINIVIIIVVRKIIPNHALQKILNLKYVRIAWLCQNIYD